MASSSENSVVEGSPAALEAGYRAALRDGSAAEFAADLERRWRADSGDVLLSVWHFRLQGSEQGADPGRAAQWRTAAAVAVVLAVVFAIFTSQSFDMLGNGPLLFFVIWGPLAACGLIAFFALSSGVNRRLWLVVVPLLVVTAYGGWGAWNEGAPEHYAILAIVHLPLLAWAAVGLYLMGTDLDDENRFAFLLKSVELVVTGGIFLGAALVFVGISLGLFDAIDMNPPLWLQRIILAATAAFVPMLACVVVYDPRLAPARQRFEQGLARLVGAVGRVLLPFTLLVGVIYIVSIPANFSKPFEQRDVLIVYNVMLFAVMGLLVICTPLRAGGAEGSSQVWLRRGLVALAAMTVVVSLYAMSATVYRTVLGGFTPNRVTIIGWNAINIALLVDYLWVQLRAGADEWVPASWRVFRWGMIAYPIWALFVVLVMAVVLVY